MAKAFSRLVYKAKSDKDKELAKKRARKEAKSKKGK